MRVLRRTRYPPFSSKAPRDIPEAGMARMTGK
jgi:hypothetical protein